MNQIIIQQGNIKTANRRFTFGILLPINSYNICINPQINPSIKSPAIAAMGNKPINNP